MIEGYLAKNDYDASVYEWWIKGLRRGGRGVPGHNYWASGTIMVTPGHSGAPSQQLYT